jgi:hypothetical protein
MFTLDKLKLAIRHVFGILVATLGTLVFLAGVFGGLDQKGDVPWWGLALIAFVGVVLLWSAWLLLRKTVATRTRPCPNCRGQTWVTAGLLRRKSRSWIMRNAGGWILECLWGASREQQVRCAQCDTLYFTETKSTRWWGVALWIFLLMLALGALYGGNGK